MDHEIESLIEGRELLTGIFGYWPSFHDAKVLNLDLWRGDVEPGLDRYVFPVLTVRIHVHELTSEVRDGHLVTRHHVIATLRFHDVTGFESKGFDHDNSIDGLAITASERKGRPAPPLHIAFEPVSFGMAAKFRCRCMEVLHVRPVAPAEHVT